MVFGVGQFEYASHTHILLGHTLVALATKICDFQQKIGYNLACAGDTPQNLAPSRSFFGIGQFNDVSQTLLIGPLLPW